MLILSLATLLPDPKLLAHAGRRSKVEGQKVDVHRACSSNQKNKNSLDRLNL